MRKAFTVLAFVLVASIASGCSKHDLRRAYDAVTAFVQTSLQKGRAGITTYCSSIGTAENEARALTIATASGSCKALRTATAIVTANAGVCNNVDLLTDAEVGNYSKVLAAEFKKAQDALKAGC